MPRRNSSTIRVGMRIQATSEMRMRHSTSPSGNAMTAATRRGGERGDDAVADQHPDFGNLEDGPAFGFENSLLGEDG